MIYTLTLNPALDYVVHVADFSVGSIFRSRDEGVFFGGKGINVSTILHELDVPNVALGFIAGFTGKAIRDGLTRRGISCDFIELAQGFSRICVKIRSGEETDINGQGPEIDLSALAALFAKVDALTDGDTLILAGSIPPSLPENIYEQIMERLFGRDIRFVVDATGDALLASLNYKPFLIKPNREELAELFGEPVETDADIEKQARRLQLMGARNVLVSLGGDGAILFDERGDVHRRAAFPGKVVNTVGAGDSMVAGFVAACAKGQDYASALLLGSATGSATAFSEGLATREIIEEVLQL